MKKLGSDLFVLASKLKPTPAALFLAWGMTSANAQDPNLLIGAAHPDYHSYQALAAIQKAACDKHPKAARRCGLTVERCLVAYRKMTEQLRAGFPEVSEAQLEATVGSLCADRITIYEFPGSRQVLSSLVEEIRKYANLKGSPIGDDFVYGSVELPDVNAEVVGSIQGSKSIVLVNSTFFEFANEFIKLVIQSMTISKTNGYLAVERDPTVIRQNFRDNPKAMQRLADLIDYFYGRGNETYHSPDRLSAKMQLAYTSGIEMFAMAHEIGHIVHGDSASSLNLASLTDTIRGLFSIEPSPVSVRLKEMNADAYALSLAEAGQREGVRGNNLNEVLILNAIEFYFIAHSILDDAGTISGLKDRRFVEPLTLNEREIESIAECVKALCDLRDLKEVSSKISSSSEYPPDAVRLQVVRRMIANSEIRGLVDQELRSFLDLASDANRNAQIFWEELRPYYISSHTLK